MIESSEQKPLFAYASSVSDADLIDAYQKTGGEPGDPAADLLLKEIERRGLDL